MAKAVRVEDTVDIPEYKKGEKYAKIVLKDFARGAQEAATAAGFKVGPRPSSLDLTDLQFKDGSKATQLGMLVAVFHEV